MNRTVHVCLLSMLIFAACSRHGSKIEEFAELTTTIDTYASQVEAKQNEVKDILAAYNQTVSKDSQLSLSFESGLRLSEHEQARLATQIEQENDPSCLALLNHIAELNEEIDALAKNIADMYKQLPAPLKVQGGEDHYALCLRYLETEHNVGKAKADSLLATITLMSNLIEGFDVWCLYEEGSFATYVAKGSACISPTCVKQNTDEVLFERVADTKQDTVDAGAQQGSVLIGSAATPVTFK